MVDCLSCQSCCGSLRSSKLYPKEKRPLSRKRAAQQLYLQKQIQNSNVDKSNNEKIDSDQMMIGMNKSEQDSYSYYRLHEKIALVSLLKKEMRKPQQQQQQSFFIKKRLGTFSCDSLSCVSSNVQSRKKQHNVNNNNNNNNNNNTSSRPTTDEQNHLLEFYVFDVSHKRNFSLTNDLNDKRLIIFYDISNGLYTIGVRNGKLNTV
ncbi:unnamed protein product [Adineta steineri]|uniref:Uncharacterized protein n=1 Tax=Adineta steineri TaxID=433720 RepID=A0A819C893_9BILA|nr:unnamed protein product [Adineta steineri]CAF3815125.1 unnamed protein product [Adineta steineri]